MWVGDFWDMFGAGHALELQNLKAIAEYRHRNGLPITPRLDEMSTAMSYPSVSLLDVSSYLPGDPIPAEYYAQFADSDELRDNLMFRAPKFRHHVAPDETATDMIERATAGLIERHGEDVITGATS